MAVGDIWYNKFNFSTNNRAWSFGVHAEETSAITPSEDGGVVSRILTAAFRLSLKGLLNVESHFESVQSWRRHTGPARPGYDKVQDGVGVVPGDAMPNDNALLVNLRQSVADSRFNGKIYLAGQSDGVHTGNRFTDPHLDGPVATFTALLPVFHSAVGPDGGQIRLVILSKRFVPAATPIGTCLDITDATANDRVVTQRRRAQKVCGFADSTN